MKTLRIRPAIAVLIVIGVLLIAACAPKTGTSIIADKASGWIRPVRMIDQDLQVICWCAGDGGIDCIPFSELDQDALATYLETLP